MPTFLLAKRRKHLSKSLYPELLHLAQLLNDLELLLQEDDCTVQNQSGSMNLRAEAGSEEIIGQSNYDDKLQIIGYTFVADLENKVWYRIILNDDQQAWVSANNIERPESCKLENLERFAPPDELAVAILEIWGIYLDFVPDANQVWDFVSWMFRYGFKVMIPQGENLSSDAWSKLYNAVSTLNGYRIALRGINWTVEQIDVMATVLQIYGVGLMDRLKEIIIDDGEGNEISAYDYLCSKTSNQSNCELSPADVFRALFETSESSVETFEFLIGTPEKGLATSDENEVDGRQPGQRVVISPQAFEFDGNITSADGRDLGYTVIELLLHEMSHRLNWLLVDAPSIGFESERSNEARLEEFELSSVPDIRKGYKLNVGLKAGEDDTDTEQFVDAVINWLLHSPETGEMYFDEEYEDFWVDLVNDVIQPIVQQQLQ